MEMGEEELHWTDAESAYDEAEHSAEQAYFTDVCVWLIRNGYEIKIRKRGGEVPVPLWTEVQSSIAPI